VTNFEQFASSGSLGRGRVIGTRPPGKIQLPHPLRQPAVPLAAAFQQDPEAPPALLRCSPAGALHDAAVPAADDPSAAPADLAADLAAGKISAAGWQLPSLRRARRRDSKPRIEPDLRSKIGLKLEEEAVGLEHVRHEGRVTVRQSDRITGSLASGS
jgi:hypothetical protein